MLLNNSFYCLAVCLVTVMLHDKDFAGDDFSLLCFDNLGCDQTIR